MGNNHFIDDSLLSLRSYQGSKDEALSCLDNFCRDSSVIVSPHKIEYWLIRFSFNMDYSFLAL